MSNALAAPLAGGTLDPLTIPKYVTPLVIPPVMNDTGTANDYDIAVRQFQQQILPGGLWRHCPAVRVRTAPSRRRRYSATGRTPTRRPRVAPDPTSQFNYPAYTVENTVDTRTAVDWINELVANPDACKEPTPATDPRAIHPHITPVDRSLHWANPELLTCGDGTPQHRLSSRSVNGLVLQKPYHGPVPIITHVHGAHVTGRRATATRRHGGCRTPTTSRRAMRPG